MKSAFETLVLHISGLENGLHEQKGKLAAEAAQHATTKNELLKVVRQEDRWRQKVAELQATLLSVQAGLNGAEKINKQSKGEVKSLKEENDKIHASVQKETASFVQERDSFLIVMESINQEMRTLQKRHRETPRPAPALYTRNDREDLKPLKELVGQLEQELALVLSEKAELSYQQEALTLKSSAANETGPSVNSTIVGSLTVMTADALAEETEQLKLTSEEHCRVIAKQKALYNKTIAEYQQLDKYILSLTHSLNELQTYCRNLESSRQACDHCRPPHSGVSTKDDSRAMEMDNPMMPHVSDV